MIDRLKRHLTAIDLGYFVILAIAFLAIWPLLKYASLPQETDAELHIFRLAELSYLIRNREFYPRWAPNFYHGYGYPIFNYYAPLVYYVGLLFELLPWFSPVAAVKAVFVLGMLIGAGSSYGTNNHRSWHPVMGPTGRNGATAAAFRLPWSNASGSARAIRCTTLENRKICQFNPNRSDTTELSDIHKPMSPAAWQEPLPLSAPKEKRNNNV